MQPRQPASAWFHPCPTCHRAGQPSRTDELRASVRASSCDGTPRRWSPRARSVNADGAESVRPVQPVVVAAVILERKHKTFGSSDVFVDNHRNSAQGLICGLSSALRPASWSCIRCPAVFSQCYVQHATAPQIHSSVSAAQSDLMGLHRTAQASGHASVSSLSRCTAYSPQRTKCAHTAAQWHVSQQMRGCLTGTSFSLVHIETPLVRSGRRLAGC